MATVTEKTKVDVHQAVKAAIAFFKESFSVMPVNHTQLEEVDMTEDGKLWLITLGYDDPAISPTPSSLDIFTRPRPLRKYKVVHVDANTGKAIAIKNR
jgi:hypothetical protein